MYLSNFDKCISPNCKMYVCPTCQMYLSKLQRSKGAEAQCSERWSIAEAWRTWGSGSMEAWRTWGSRLRGRRTGESKLTPPSQSCASPSQPNIFRSSGSVSPSPSSIGSDLPSSIGSEEQPSPQRMHRYIKESPDKDLLLTWKCPIYQ